MVTGRIFGKKVMFALLNYLTHVSQSKIYPNEQLCDILSEHLSDLGGTNNSFSASSSNKNSNEPRRLGQKDTFSNDTINIGKIE